MRILMAKHSLSPLMPVFASVPASGVVRSWMLSFAEMPRMEIPTCGKKQLHLIDGELVEYIERTFCDLDVKTNGDVDVRRP